MRKIYLALLFAALFTGSCFALSYTNLYTVTASTDSVTSTTTIHADLDKADIRIKQLTITNPTATSQTVTLYKNATATTTVTAIGSWTIPAEANVFYPISQTVLDDDENFKCPYFAVRTDTNTASVQAKVTILYK